VVHGARTTVDDKDSHTRCKGVKAAQRLNNKNALSAPAVWAQHSARWKVKATVLIARPLGKYKSKVPAASSQWPTFWCWTSEEGVSNFMNLSVQHAARRKYVVVKKNTIMYAELNMCTNMLKRDKIIV